MVKIRELKAERALNPTSIDLGDYVINPYVGCAFGCLYCYVRNAKAACKRAEPWGAYVDAKVNVPELLERELPALKPGKVLLGSTTECFQPAERHYRLTERILTLLNGSGVSYVILTRSPLILDSLDLLTQGFCKAVYVTVNAFPPGLKSGLEPASPAFEDRIRTVNALIDASVPVIPYFSPLLPGISDINAAFALFPKAAKIELECLNFSLRNISGIIRVIAAAYPHLRETYERMLADRDFFDGTWENMNREIQASSRKTGIASRMHIHDFGGFFGNTYTKS